MTLFIILSSSSVELGYIIFETSSEYSKQRIKINKEGMLIFIILIVTARKQKPILPNKY